MPPWGRFNAARNTTWVDATRREEVVSGLRLDPKIPPLGAKGWGTASQTQSHPSRRRRRVGHPQNLRLNSGMELLADLTLVVIRKMQSRVGHPPRCVRAVYVGCPKLHSL